MDQELLDHARQTFVEEVARTLHTVLSRQQTYGTEGIDRNGLMGIAVMLDNKICRLREMLGFGPGMDERVGPSVAPTLPSAALWESIQDTLRDVTGYGLIGLLVMRRAWVSFDGINIQIRLEDDSDGQG